MTLNEYNYLQSRFSRKLKKSDYTSKNAGYNAGISECRSIIEVEYNRMVEKEDQMDLPEYGCLQDRFSHALKNPAHTNRESSYNAAILSCKSILKEVFKHKEDLSKYVISNGITFYYNDSIVLTEKLISTLEEFSKSPECQDEAYTLVEDKWACIFLLVKIERNRLKTFFLHAILLLRRKPYRLWLKNTYTHCCIGVFCCLSKAGVSSFFL